MKVKTHDRRCPMYLRSRFAAALFATLTLGCAPLSPVEAARGSEQTLVACVLPPVTPCTDRVSCWGRFGVAVKKVPYYRNYALQNANTAVKRALIIVHGVGRNASGIFGNVLDAAALTASSGVDPCATTNTIILAPHFLNETDGALADELFWGGSEWSGGNKSNNAGTQVSSYAVIDDLVQTVANQAKFPNLTEIVIAGHSAGGQLTQRYAAGNRLDGTLRAGLSLRYVPANPSSYLYLRKERPTPAAAPQYIEPYVCVLGICTKKPDFATLPSCASRYNDYRYGFDSMNSYMAATGASAIKQKYPKRDVTYFLGQADLDTGAGDTNFDDSCPAQYQGLTRLARGRRYKGFLDTFFPGHAHRLVTVLGAGHSAAQMFVSQQGTQVLFAP